MAFREIVVGLDPPGIIAIHPGEFVELAIEWVNPDGSPKDVSQATITAVIRDVENTVVCAPVLTTRTELVLSQDTTAALEAEAHVIDFELAYPDSSVEILTFSMLVSGVVTKAVDITVMDDSAAPAAIAGATIQVTNPLDASFVAYGVSDAAGVCRLALPGSEAGTDYEGRTFKLGVQFANPFTISVFDPVPTGETNDFDVTGTIVGSFGVPSDPRVCRCVGRFVSFQNRPIASMMARLNAPSDPGLKVPKIVDSNMVSPDALEARTDRNGYLSLDLFRGSEYRITFSGEDDITWNFKVPDRPTANLVELIHPQPLRLSWDPVWAPGNTVTMAVGQTVDVAFAVEFSDYITRTDGLSTFLTLTLTNALIADGGYSYGTGVRLTGMSPGSTAIVPSLVPNLYPKRLPDYAPVLPTLTVVVTA